MFDTNEMLSKLTTEQRARLLELLASGNSLPWIDIDDELKALTLVQPGHRRVENATLNNWGWQIAMQLRIRAD